MRYIALLLFAVIAFSGCQRESKMAVKTGSEDSSFVKLSEDYIAGFLKARPRSATYLGIHKYDGQLSDLSKSALDAELARIKSFDQQMINFDTAALSIRMKMDFKILHAAIKQELFAFEDLRQYQTSPLLYASSVDMSLYVTRDFAPLEARMRFVDKMQRMAPVLLTHARENLDDSLARPHVETAIQIAKGAAAFMEKQLKEAFAAVKNDSLHSAFSESSKLSVKALRDYATWLEKEKLPKAHNRYAIGRDNYVKMLLYNER